MVVVGVSTDPKPDSDVCIQNGKRAISEPHACCVDWLNRMDLLEAKARVQRVALEAAMGFTSAAASMFGEPVGEAGGGFECFPHGFRHCRDSALDGTKSCSTRSTSTVNICAQRRAQRPEREHRECPARCSVTLGRSKQRRLSWHDLAGHDG